MSRLLLTLTVLALALPAAAQEVTLEKKVPWANKFFTGEKSSPPPVILQDFGTVPQGTVKTYRFKMTNIYAVPMQVREPKPSCGCVSVIEYTGKMEPRETGHIDIKIDTSRVDGQKVVRLPVHFDARDAKTGQPFFSEAELEVRVNSRPDISIKPGFIEFGTVAVGEKAGKSATIYYTGRQAGWEIKEFGYKKELLDVKIEPLAVRGGVAYKLTASLKASAPAGAFDEQIVLKTNDNTSPNPVLILNVSGLIQAPLSVVGAPGGVLKMEGVVVGKKSQKQIIIRAEKAFKIDSVEGQGDGVSTSLVPMDAAKAQVVPIVFEPKKVGPVKKTLSIKTDTGETVTITVEGIGIEP
jgi:hypothetical protein